ncbi:LAGLIDADG family homing endonuclease [Thermococcus sp.]|uniref:LAGLIDADG family homing endonuclease n=1 Tax=Thermococcus sp. TaxID=35749 RepID=UPI002630E8C5|nr:LAGLIDADG family homing endonuclease [Thermococcus sp.]
MRSLKELSPTELQIIVGFAMGLRKEKGISYRMIVSKVAEEFDVKVSKATVIRWCKGDSNPFNKIKRINLTPSPELSYIIGVYLGDGSIHQKSNGRYLIKLKVVDKEFAETFSKTLLSLGVNSTFGFERDASRVNRGYVEASNKELFMFLNKPVDKLIETAEYYPTEFLRGFFDSEGYPIIEAKNRFRVMVGVANSSLKMINAVRDMLAQLGINSILRKSHLIGREVVIRGIKYTSKVDMYTLTISRKADVKRFAKLVGFSSPTKMKKLQFAIQLMDLPNDRVISEWHELYYKTPRGYKLKKTKGKTF